jgi:hypothetical protein
VTMPAPFVVELQWPLSQVAYQIFVQPCGFPNALKWVVTMPDELRPGMTGDSVVVSRANVERFGRLLAELLHVLEEGYDFQPTTPAAAPAAALATEHGAAHIWDTSPEALEEYDGATLVALRVDHRADSHDPTGCPVCDVLARRLGGL